MSPRAAARLETLGYKQVYDYADGKLDWFAADLPAEGQLPDAPYLGEHARRNVPTCRPGEEIGRVRDLVRASGWDRCVVVNDERVVLGLLERSDLDGHATEERRVEQVIRPGPSTLRPSVPLEKSVQYMRENGLDGVLATTSEGKLVGFLSLEQALEVLRAAGKTNPAQETDERDAS